MIRLVPPSPRCLVTASSVLLLGLLASSHALAQEPAGQSPEGKQQVATAPSADADQPVADRTEALPPEFAGMQVVEHLNQAIPLDLAFTDQTGKKVKLSDYFDGRRPVILTLNYFRCPMLCGLILNAAVDALKPIDWTMGDEFRLLTVSFDPIETWDLANLKRQNYLRDYGRPTAADGWDFLTGQQEPIKALLDATGYPVRWNESNNQWIHPACIIVLTPDGRISRYLYGVYFEPKTMRLALVEASQGRIGSTIDHILLWCCQYDPSDGTYTLAAMRLAQAGGTLTLVVLGSFLAFFWRHERRRKRAAPAAVADSENPQT